MITKVKTKVSVTIIALQSQVCDDYQGKGRDICDDYRLFSDRSVMTTKVRIKISVMTIDISVTDL